MQIDKAIAYVQLRKPFSMNNLEGQRDVLMDRRRVYEVLKSAEIPVSPHLFMSREEGSTDVMFEDEDWIEINGVRINKPFVEKPVDAEDHNVYIYYPMNAGGGSKRCGFIYKTNDDPSVENDDSSVKNDDSSLENNDFLWQPLPEGRRSLFRELSRSSHCAVGRCVFKMMNFALKMMNFALERMNFALKIMNFVSKIMKPCRLVHL